MKREKIGKFTIIIRIKFSFFYHCGNVSFIGVCVFPSFILFNLSLSFV